MGIYLLILIKPLWLTPKKNQPIIPQDYRPFGLCNDIYKIIAKSFANRVKDHLPNYISQAQSIFIAKRYISSNIIITQEIIHYFYLKIGIIMFSF
jgi:hypothetical protein